MPCCVFILTLGVSIFASCDRSPAPGQQILITEGLSIRVVDAYWLYLPRNYDQNKEKWPIILFLQGGYGVSPNPNTSKSDGPSKFALLHAQKSDAKSIVADTFIIVNPHMRVGPKEKRQWYQYPKTNEQVLQDIIEQYNGDPDRIYLTDLSRGGHGSWELAKILADQFAAIVSIAGRIRCSEDCGNSLDLPLWIVHNTCDEEVDFDYAEDAVEVIENKYGQKFMRTETVHLKQPALTQERIFTALHREGHDAWNETYNSIFLYKWLLCKHR